jgi:NAD(P)-dependent dehydrogenase (short-subunit alcohol dehydrogenase family)
MARQIVVVIGVGGMGELIAERQGAGHTVLLADFAEDALARVAERLRDNGHDVMTQRVDVGDATSVAALARTAADAGEVVQVAHTAGLSPTMAPVAAILRVDMLGVALSLDAFGKVIARGGSGVVIASMAGHLSASAFPPDLEAALAGTPTAELLNLPIAQPGALSNSGIAYSLAKRANQLRVAAASLAWGERGARVNSISPGVISTGMGQLELTSDSGAGMRAMIAASGTGRIGTPTDIANAAAFLLGPDSSFITGTDLAVDGGVVAAARNGRWNPPAA